MLANIFRSTNAYSVRVARTALFCQSRGIVTPSLALKPYILSGSLSSLNATTISPAITAVKLSPMALTPLQIIKAPVLAAATAGVVVPTAYFISKVANTPMGQGAQSAFSGVMYLVTSFIPPGAYQNLYADMSMSLLFLLVSFFGFQLFPEIMLKDHVFMYYVAFLILPLFPFAFSYAPLFNTRAFLFL